MDEPLTVEELRATQLPVRRWGSGYDVAEVDALLQRAAATLQGRAALPLTAPEVAAAGFTVRRRRGYAMDGVDDLLDRVTDALTPDRASAPPRPAAAPAAGPTSTAQPATPSPTSRVVPPAPVQASSAELPRAGFLAQGYARQEVDVLLRRAASALTHQGASGPTLTADDVRAATFTTTRRGRYDVAAVDDLLDLVAAALPPARR
ncbi:DivIVA domain-containing protein [Pseudokineococcus sp. 1T1Z-3]|uniref:DivIVA domain-containing protein n=1 Tax=Pseudokineococcus sp. 1T1Z-3 TaxID=3132745 RepID=UPI00309A4D2F